MSHEGTLKKKKKGDTATIQNFKIKNSQQYRENQNQTKRSSRYTSNRPVKKFYSNLYVQVMLANKKRRENKNMEKPLKHNGS